MKINLIFLFFITIFYLNPFTFDTSSVYQYINGSIISGNWEFNFQIYSKKINGIIFYVIDSKGSQIGISILKFDNSVQLNYNKIRKRMQLKELCGCGTCDNSLINFNLKSERGYIKINCNKGRSKLMSTYVIGNSRKKFFIYPTPLQIKDKYNKLYVTIGSIGSYIGVNNIIVTPSTDSMVGCLKKFLYNQREIKMNTRKMIYCLEDCKTNICNGGLCIEQFTERALCKCLNVALNGRFCNESLRKYEKKESNTYIKVQDIKNFNFKMTWSPSNYKNHCILSIVRGSDKTLLWIKDEELMMDISVIKEIKNNEINFVILTLENDYLVINYGNSTLRLSISHNEGLKINVGFSESEQRCTTFYGNYDVNFDNLEFYRSQPKQLHTSTESLETYMMFRDNASHVELLSAMKHLPSRSQKYSFGSKWTMIYVGLPIALIIVLLSVAILVTFLRNKKPEKIKNTKETISQSVLVTDVNFSDDTEYSKLEYNEFLKDDNDGYAVPIQKVEIFSLPPLPPRNLDEGQQ